MNLTDYFRCHHSHHIGSVAVRAGTNLHYLRQCKYGRRRMSGDLAVWLEHVTAGELTARELRPDLPWPDSSPARREDVAAN